MFFSKLVSVALGYFVVLFILIGLVMLWHDHGRWVFHGEVASKFRYDRVADGANGKVELAELLNGKPLAEAIETVESSRFKCAETAGNTTCTRARGGVVQFCPEDWEVALVVDAQGVVTKADGRVSFACG